MPYSIPEEKLATLQDLIFRHRKIEAIKLYRELTGLGLKESKDEVEALENSLRQTSPERFVSGPQGKGCAGSAAALCLAAVGLLVWLSYG